MISNNSVNPATNTKLKEIKARIMRLHSDERHQKLIDTAIADRTSNESPSLYHVMRTKKRQGMRNIASITDAHGKIHYDIPHILQTFTTDLKKKYASIPLNAAQMHRWGHK
jgi:hypothetical protein